MSLRATLVYKAGSGTGRDVKRKKKKNLASKTKILTLQTGEKCHYYIRKKKKNRRNILVTQDQLTPDARGHILCSCTGPTTSDSGYLLRPR